ncbi:MAG: SDR family oxidoreductase [Candidatus Heimdallarchaeota archaeon]
MDLGLSGKIAICAASSKGIGKAIAVNLAKEGAYVTICARGEEALHKTKEEIRTFGGKVLAVKADVTDYDQVQNLVKETIKTFGNPQILVNNAGGPPQATFQEVDIATWREAVDLNLMSTIYLSREVVPYMIKARWGRIINMTSVSVKQPIDNLLLSNTVRSGVIGLTKSLSNELGPYNITVNSVAPGYTLTKRLRDIAQKLAEETNRSLEDQLKEMAKDVPLGRVGQPEEIANLVVFLASEKASYITGTTIQVDGGLVKSLF